MNVVHIINKAETASLPFRQSYNELNQSEISILNVRHIIYKALRPYRFANHATNSTSQQRRN